MKFLKAVMLVLVVLMLTSSMALAGNKGGGRSKGGRTSARSRKASARRGGNVGKAGKQSKGTAEKAGKQDKVKADKPGEDAGQVGRGEHNATEAVVRQMAREEHKNRKRIANLERVRNMLAEKDNLQASAQLEKVLAKETARHERVMARLESRSGDATERFNALRNRVDARRKGRGKGEGQDLGADDAQEESDGDDDAEGAVIESVD